MELIMKEKLIKLAAANSPGAVVEAKRLIAAEVGVSYEDIEASYMYDPYGGYHEIVFCALGEVVAMVVA